MLDADKANSLAKWITNCGKTYGGNSRINECITWLE